MMNSLLHARSAWRLFAAAITAMAVLAACSAPEDALDLDPGDPVVTAVTIEGGAESLSLQPGQSRGLDFVVEPADEVAQEVAWSSDDPDVASIDENGVVSANSVGAATITAASVQDPEQEDTIRVLVGADTPAWRIAIAEERVTLAPGGTESLDVDVIVPDGESDEVDWQSDDGSVVTVSDGGVLTAVGVGTATVTGTLVADDDYSDSVFVTVSEDASIGIQQNDLSLYPGETTTLGVDVHPEGDVRWSSSDPGVVAIEGADTDTPTITAVAEGTSTITVASADEPGLSDSITVTVEEITIVIEPSTVSVAVDGTVDLTPIVGAPEGETGVTWTSDDAGIATVDANGLVTGVAVGETTVWATSEYDTDVRASVGVEVVAAGPEAPSVDIAEETVTLSVGGTQALTVTVDVPEGESDALRWSSDPTGVVTVDEAGNVTAVAEGTATVTAELASDASVRDSVDVTVTDAAAEPPAGEFDFVVTSLEDYDPYALQGWTPEEPIEGTLRWALENAQDGDVIGFADGIDEVVVTGVDAYDDPADGNVDAHLVVRDDVTIVGPEGGVTIRGASGYVEGEDPPDGAGGFTYRSRVMAIPDGTNVTLENVTIAGGDFIYLGAGIRNDGTLTLRDVTVTGNRAWTYGGGVFNNGGVLTLENTVISGNGAYTTAEELETGTFAIRGGYEIGMSDTGYAGGLYVNGGTVTVDAASEITNNEAKYNGGGISMTGGSIDADGALIAGNVAEPSTWGGTGPSGGGGVSVFGGTFDLANGAINDNTSGVYGGGVQLMTGGEAVLTEVTFTGNAAEYGDAIYHEFESDPAENLTLVGGNVTVGGPGYYPPDADDGMALRASPTATQTLPEPSEHPDWLR